MAKQNFGGVYANMDFPTYEYREYPKHIRTGPHGKYEVVNDAREEEDILAKLRSDIDNAPAEFLPPVADPERDLLVSRARELSVPINRKWSIEKLKQTISSAEREVDDLPADENNEEDNSEPTATSDENKEELVAKAKSLGISVNKLWGAPRIKMAIEEAEAKKSI